MAFDNRDRSFEKALSRHLRPTAGPSESPYLRPGAVSQTPACLDPETLAAYHERGLLPEQMNSAKEHIVGCAHCQHVLAQLEMTDSIALAPAENEKELAPAASVQKARSPIAIRGPRWTWLVPAGALAAGLLMWIGLHENRPDFSSRENETKMAKAQEPAPPVPTATRQTPVAPSTEPYDALSKNSGAVGGAATGERLREAETSKQKVAPSARGVPAKPSLDKEESSLRKDTGRDSLDESKRPHQVQDDLDAKSAPVAAVSEQTEVPAQAEAANARLQNQQTQNQPVQNQQTPAQFGGPIARGPAPSSHMEQSKKAKSDSGTRDYRAFAPSGQTQQHQQAPQQAPPPAAPAAGSSDSSALLVAGLMKPSLIAVPGTHRLWRAGAAGRIEFSSNNGSSWTRQVSGVLTDLTAGSAPSAKICWIVGRAGTILRTTDGGAHWFIIQPPLADDLGGVLAVDALHAAIWNLDHTKAFETADGGVTWKPVSAP